MDEVTKLKARVRALEVILNALLVGLQGRSEGDLMAEIRSQCAKSASLRITEKGGHFNLAPFLYDALYPATVRLEGGEPDDQTF